MVQCILTRRCLVPALVLLLVGVVLCTPAFPSDKGKADSDETWPELLLDGGRKLTYERTLSAERDIRGKSGFWTKLTNVVIGEPDYKQMVRPYDVAVDSHGRIIVTDPGLGGVHIFDPAQHKYKFIERYDTGKDDMQEPQCLTVDDQDNIYVTDSKVGKIFVFGANGKYKHVIGSLKGGEGFFKRPTGIAFDSESKSLYVTDTLRDRVFVMSLEGVVLRGFGESGSGDGQFNYPAHVLVKNGTVAVVDAMNFRVQLFDKNGTFRGSIGTAGDPTQGIFRPKGIALDSEGHIYLAEADTGLVEIFDREGNLLYNFGTGTGFGDFLLPAGISIDRNDRVYVVDSFNHRVQVFHYYALKASAGGGVQ